MPIYEKCGHMFRPYGTIFRQRTITKSVQNQHETHTTKWVAQLINTVKPQHKKDRMKYNMIIITTYLVKNYWQAHSAVDFIVNSVLPKDGPVVLEHVAKEVLLKLPHF
jgi:hypothetical protein